MAARRRTSRRGRPSLQHSVIIRINDIDDTQPYREVELAGPDDRELLARAVSQHVRVNPQSPVILAVSGHQQWLADTLSTCLNDDCTSIADLNREVLFSSTAKFPERTARRGKNPAWQFIIDQMNVPEVYYWSLNLPAPHPDEYGYLSIDKVKLRTGVWVCAKNACKFDPRVAVVVLCTRRERVPDLLVCRLLFDFLRNSELSTQPVTDDEWICWIFSRLHWLLTDWQNIIREVHGRLEAAEINSYHRQYPVKYRTRTMHREIARIHELKENLRFHTRCFRRLARLKNDAPPDSRSHTLWQDIEDAVEDLEQHEGTLNSLKERLDNLLGLEFNIQAADQNEDSSFLSIIAALFLPISYLSGLWGISTSTWAVLWYVYAAVPVFVISAAFLVIYPWARARWQKVHYQLDQSKIMLRRRDYTMLGAELPEDVDVPSDQAWGRARHRSQQVGDSGPPARRRSRRASVHDDVRVKEV